MVDRKALGEQLFKEGKVKDNKDGTWIVNSFEVTEDACECPDFKYRCPDDGCKHIWAVKFWKMKHGVNRILDNFIKDDINKEIYDYIEANKGMEQSDLAFSISVKFMLDEDICEFILGG